MSSAGPSVLVIDDDGGIRVLLKAVLESDGCRVDFAEDGVSGLEKLASSLPDVVLLDLLLPRMTGFEVIEHLQATDPALLGRVIVLSAVSEKQLLRVSSPPLRRVLRKPFDIAELLTCVHECAGRGVRPRLSRSTGS